MIRPALAATILAAMFVPAEPTWAGVLVPIAPVPGSVAMMVIGINDNNVVTGSYKTADGQFHGYVGTIDGNYETFDYPTGFTAGRTVTNDGYIVGSANPSGDHVYGEPFIRAPDGTMTTITRNGKVVDGLAQGLHDNGRFVGEDWTFRRNFRHLRVLGFYGKGSEYRQELVLPFHTDKVRPRGFNKHGDVVGLFHDRRAGDTPGFLIRDGVAAAIRFPDPQTAYTFFEEITDKGKVAGFWTDYTQMNAMGVFVYDERKEAFDSFDVPHTSYLVAEGINSSDIVAVTADNSAYLYCMHKAGCPQNAHAVEVKDRWISARDTMQRVRCKQGCTAPAKASREPQPDASDIRSAMANDPVSRFELGIVRR